MKGRTQEVLRTRKIIRRARKIRLAGTFSSLVLFAIAILAIFPLIPHLDQAEATVNPSTTSLTVTSATNTATVEVTPTSSGTFATSSSDIAFDVITNNITGYNLSIVGSDNNGLLSNTVSGSVIDTLSPLSAATSAATFSSSSSYNGKWGYKPSKLNSSANTDYLPAPGTSGTTIDVTNAANSAANSYTIGLGARVDDTKPAGAYTNTFTLASVARPAPYQINYLDSSTSPETVFYQETGADVFPQSFTLTSSTPTRAGYTFNKWCYGTVTHVTKGNSTCSGTEYAAGATFNFTNPSAVTTNIANLYAMWNVGTYNLVVTGDAGLDSMNVRQGSTSGTIVSGTKSGNTVTFTGLTYGTSYYLYPTLTASYQFQSWAKTDSVADAVLGSTSTENTYYTMGAGNGAITLTTSVVKTYIQNLPEIECTTTAKTVWDNRDDQPYTIKRLGDGNCWMIDNLNLGADDYSFSGGLTSSNTNITGTVSNADFYQWKNSSTGSATQARFVPVSGRDSSYSNSKYGVLYNYCAASAGTYCASSGSGDATQDLCPAGWRLPVGGGASDTNNEFRALYTYYGNNYNMLRNDAGFSMPGAFTNAGDPTTVDTTNSYYWSSKYYSGAYMYEMRLTTSAAYPAQGIQRFTGASVRCVMKPQAKTYIQDLPASECTTASKTVYDIRDDQPYTIKRLSDGECWMTKNLNLGSADYPLAVSELNSSNTNTTSSYSSSAFTNWKVEEGTSVGGYQYTAPKFMPLSGTDTNGIEYGTLYNFCAASAGTFCYTSSTSTSSMPAEATEDLCPSGWGLPSGGSSNTDFYNLYSYYDYNSLTSASGVGFTLSGLFQNQSNTAKGTTGRYYSRNRSGQQQVKTLNFSNGAFDHNAASYRYAGLSVRCILKPKKYLQNITSSDCTTTASTAYDIRDNQPYTIKRLNDGNCWIIENLNLGAVSISKDLDSTNTNITTTITPAEFNGDSASSTDNWKILPDATYNTSTHSTAIKPRYIQITSSNSQTGSDTDPTAGTKYGVLYNYCAASGETICIANNTANATEDICPAGWRLPTGGSGGEFATLYSQSAYNSYANMRKSIADGGPAFAFAGTFNGSGVIYQNQRGQFWSSTRATNANTYNLYFANGVVQTSGSLARTNFYSTRCLLK